MAAVVVDEVLQAVATETDTTIDVAAAMDDVTTTAVALPEATMTATSEEAMVAVDEKEMTAMEVVDASTDTKAAEVAADAMTMAPVVNEEADTTENDAKEEVVKEDVRSVTEVMLLDLHATMLLLHENPTAAVLEESMVATTDMLDDKHISVFGLEQCGLSPYDGR